MMTPQQKRNLLLIMGGVVILAIILLLFLLLRRPVEEVLPPELDLQPAPATEVRDETPRAPVVEPVTPGASSAQVVAATFAERFGTWSTDAPYANVDEIQDLATPALFAQLNASRSSEVAETYTGVTARVLATSLETGSEETGQMQFVASLQEQRFEGDRTRSTTSYRRARVTVDKVGDAWLVSSFVWE